MEVKVVSWSDRSYRDILRDIRQKVFVEEQGVPANEEWDDKDNQAIHFIAFDGKRPVGCARLFKDGYFGRMAVLAEHRHNHWGSRLIRAIGDYYQVELRGRLLKASVQAQAYNFYLHNGFIPQIEFFWDAGIPHLTMTKAIGRGNGVASSTFEMGKDSELYKLENEAAIEGLFQIACQNKPRKLFIGITELQHPMWSSQGTLDCIKRYLRSSSRRQIDLLIRNEYPGISDHPLIRLSNRISSRICVKVHSGLTLNGALFDPDGYLLIQGSHVKACFNCRVTTIRHKREFADLWRAAQPTREARQLRL